MKKLLIVTLLCMLLGGCAESQPQVVVSVEKTESIHNTVFGQSALVEIGDYLWYDSSTRIVYWWNGTMAMTYHSTTTPSPYYAPNGLPYRYDPERNIFEEIE